MTAPRILVVEDEYMLAMHLHDGLCARGIEVVGPVATLGAALALLEPEPDFDAAILDVNLDGEKSYPLAQRLQRVGIPFVFASGYDLAMLPSEFAASPHCLKPVDLDQALQQLGF
jgi:DNA-binding response OmpR family regulator